MTGYQMQQSQIDEALRNTVGSYRLMTDKAVWIPRRGTTGGDKRPGSITGAKAVAADWGCNLLVLLDTKMARNNIKVQSRNEERVFLVHAGMQ